MALPDGTGRLRGHHQLTVIHLEGIRGSPPFRAFKGLEMVTQRKSNIPPHHRLTLKDVIRDHQEGLLTAKGAIFYTVASSRKLGDEVRLNPAHFIQVTGMSKANFYKKLAELKLQRRIDFEIEGAVILKVPIEENTGTPEYIFLSELSQKRDSESQKVDKKSQKRDSESQKVDKKSSEPAPSKDSGSPLSIQSLQSNLSSQDEQKEKDRLEDDPKFHEWLKNKANSLPKKPALLELWVQKQAQNEANQKEYQQYLESLQKVKLPAIPLVEEITNPHEYWKRLNQRRNDNG